MLDHVGIFGDVFGCHLVVDVNHVGAVDLLADVSGELLVHSFRERPDAKASLSCQDGLLAGAFYDFLKMNCFHPLILICESCKPFVTLVS